MKLRSYIKKDVFPVTCFHARDMLACCVTAVTFELWQPAMAEILKEELQRMKIASKMADFLLGSAHCPERLFAPLTFSRQVGGASECRPCPSCVSPPLAIRWSLAL